MLTEEDEYELSAGFDVLAEYRDECDVEYAIYAQAEVILGNEAEYVDQPVW